MDAGVEDAEEKERLRLTVEERIFCMAFYIHGLANNHGVEHFVPGILDGDVPPLGPVEEYKKFEDLHENLRIGLHLNGSKFEKHQADLKEKNYLNDPNLSKRRRLEASGDWESGQDAVPVPQKLRFRDRETLGRHGKWYVCITSDTPVTSFCKQHLSPTSSTPDSLLDRTNDIFVIWFSYIQF